MNKSIWVLAIAGAFIGGSFTAGSLVEASEFLIASDLRPIDRVAVGVEFVTNTDLVNSKQQTISAGDQMVGIILLDEPVVDIKDAVAESLNAIGYNPADHRVKLVTKEMIDKVVIVGALTTLGGNLNTQ